MVLIGLFIHGNLQSWNIKEMRLFYSVLMMLGFGYLIAVALVLYASLRAQILITAAILLIYWALQMFVPVPGHVAGAFEKGKIFSDWFCDQTVGMLGAPWKSQWGRDFPITLWNHGVTAMLGVFAARILQAPWKNLRKLKWLTYLKRQRVYLRL